MHFAACHHTTAQSLFKPFFTTSHCTYREAVSLARLVKAEIVSPYHGILINTGMGNQTGHQLRCSGNKRFYQVSGEAHRLFCPYKGTKIHPFYPRLLPPCLSILAHSSSSAQVRVFLLKPLQACLERDASGWSPPSWRETSRS